MLHCLWPPWNYERGSKKNRDWEPENWILLLALLVLTSVQLIKLPGIGVLICQRHRTDRKTQCSVRNVELIWPIGHWDLSWEVSKLTHQTWTCSPKSQVVGPAHQLQSSPPSSAPFYMYIALSWSKSCLPVRFHREKESDMVSTLTVNSAKKLTH